MASQNTSIMISQIYKSRNTLVNLLTKQGYNTSDYSNFSVNEVNSMKLNNQLDMLLEKTTEDADTGKKPKIYIRYYLAKTIRPANLQEMIDDLFLLTETLTKDDTLFIVIKDEPNETLINDLKHIWEIFIVIENIKRLQFNILEHVLVPRHVILEEKVIKQVMEKYNLMQRTQFPEISRFDPVARVIGMRPGQVCQITRPSKTAIESNYYRVCV